MMFNNFLVLICHLYILFCEISLHVFWPFSKWIVCLLFHYRVLRGHYVGLIQGICQIRDLQIFCHVCSLSFHSLNRVFHSKKQVEVLNSHVEKPDLYSRAQDMVAPLVVTHEGRSQV